MPRRHDARLLKRVRSAPQLPILLSHSSFHTLPSEAGSKAASGKGADSKEGGGGKAGACGSGDASPLLKPGSSSSDGGKSKPVTRRPLALPCGHRFCEPCISQCALLSSSLRLVSSSCLLPVVQAGAIWRWCAARDQRGKQLGGGPS